MHELALFAGVGGGLLATKWLLGFETVCYVENNPYRVQVLRARIKEGLLDDAPIWGDAKTFDGRPWAGSVDIITAGFPCQPFSGAGKGLGEEDPRNMWPDTIRIVREVWPQWVLLENVSRLLSHAYVRRIFADLAESGYDCRWDCIPASAVGANHQRDRLWIVATYANSTELRLQSRGRCRAGRQDSSELADDGPTQPLAHANSGRLKEHSQLNSQAQQDPPDRDSRGRHTGGCGDEMADPDQQGSPQREAEGFIPDVEPAQRQGWWAVEPRLGRVADGVANRVVRIAAIGDGQVPRVVKTVWELIGGIR